MRKFRFTGKGLARQPNGMLWMGKTWRIGDVNEVEDQDGDRYAVRTFFDEVTVPKAPEPVKVEAPVVAPIKKKRRGRPPKVKVAEQSSSPSTL